MRPKRADTKWNGVFFDPKGSSMPYEAWVKANKKLVHLGYYATALEAILVADFARYVLWGIDPQKWYNDARHRSSKPPNTVPVVNLPFDRHKILCRLTKCVDGATMAANLTAYNEMALKLEKAGAVS